MHEPATHHCITCDVDYTPRTDWPVHERLGHEIVQVVDTECGHVLANCTTCGDEFPAVQTFLDYVSTQCLACRHA